MPDLTVERLMTALKKEKMSAAAQGVLSAFLQEFHTMLTNERALRDALKDLVESPVVSGLSAAIRDEARRRKVDDPYRAAVKALEAFK